MQAGGKPRGDLYAVVERASTVGDCRERARELMEEFAQADEEVARDRSRRELDPTGLTSST